MVMQRTSKPQDVRGERAEFPGTSKSINMKIEVQV